MLSADFMVLFNGGGLIQYLMEGNKD